MAQEISQSRASVLLATSHSNSIVHAIHGYPASSPGRPFVTGGDATRTVRCHAAIRKQIGAKITHEGLYTCSSVK